MVGTSQIELLKSGKMSTQANKLVNIAPAVDAVIGIPQQSTEMALSDSLSTTTTVDSNGGSKQQRKKRKVAIACVYCRRSHMICDESRPCQRCLKRNIGHLCHDEPVSTRQKKRLLAKQSSSGSQTPPAESPLVGSTPTPNTVPTFILEGQRTQNTGFSFPITNQPKSQQPQQQQQQQHSSLYLNQQPVFFSEHAGSEFSSLNEFLSMIDDPEFLTSMNNDPILQNIDSAMSNGNSAVNLSLFDNKPPIQSNNIQEIAVNEQPNAPIDQKQITPVVTDNARDKFFLTAADPTTEISPEERLKQVINAKLEAGLLKPYNYAEGYARLQRYMDSHMNPSSRQRILKPLSVFRPAFRAIAKTLKDIDLMLVEESFERMLLDYDRVFTSMAIPLCLWRRSGEIYRGNKEFASLVEVNIDDLKNGKLTIYELMSEESSVNFWEKYGSIAFDKTQKAVLTSCKLKTKDGRKKKNCCFSFTIRRDRYNIPSCIVGNFIPIAE